MFRWFRAPTPKPATSQANPAKGIRLTASFTDGERTWTEHADALDCLAKALHARRHPFKKGAHCIELEVGMVLQPGLVEFQPIHKQGVSTVTTVEVSWPDLIPQGVFEFQHSTGDNLQQSLLKGFESWLELDFPVLADVPHVPPKACLALEAELPGAESQKRRALLGPVSHLVHRSASPGEDEHPFCPCCMFTKLTDVLKPKFLDNAFYGIRLFAMRDEQGAHVADCRVNGVDWDPGKQALINYVSTWPDLGFEFRKQYVVLHNLRK